MCLRIPTARIPLGLILVAAVLSGLGCAELDYRTTLGPLHPGCGGYRRVIDWELPGGAPSDGWVVQKMTIELNIVDCADNPSGWPSRTYWEAWRVRENDSFSNPRSDTWNVPSSPANKGSWSFDGEARFFGSLDLPADFTANNPNTYAGTLRATTTEPGFWPGTLRRILLFWLTSNMVVRRVAVEFDCCGEAPGEQFEDSHDR